MCQICGQPDNIRCNCQVTQPFCDQCGNDNDCVEKMDAQCVFYHLNCTNPAGLVNLGIPCNTDLETILEALDDLVGNSFNIPFQGQETSSIRWVSNGPAGHKPYAHVKISEDDGNIAEIHADGVFVPAPVIPDPEPVEFVNVTNDCITITVTQDEDGKYRITPSIDIVCLINKIRTEHLVEFCELVSECTCLQSIANLTATFAAACPNGFILNEETEQCESTETTPPNVSGSIVTACPTQYYQYSQYGAIVYNGGFNAAGEGIGANITADITAGNVTPITTNEVWRDNVNNAGTNDPHYGPANRAALWSCDSPTFVGTLGFVVPINAPTTKTYYVAVAADNEFQIDVDGVNVVTSNNGTGNAYWMSDGGAKFRFWHIYPINLTAGVHTLSVAGTNVGGPGFFAAEVYDNTLAELQAAALDPAFTANRAAFPLGSNPYSNLNLIFTTRCARGGGSFTVGNATCPDNTWTLDTTGGSPLTPPCQGINNDTSQWVCRRTTTAPFSGYTATLVWDRIPSAINYTVEQKPTGDPDTSYVACVGSPVANPVSGTTVNLVVSGLPTDEFTFRVKANFETCSTEFEPVEAEKATCVPVSLSAVDNPLLPATNGVAYYEEFPLSGTGPFLLVLSGLDVPVWMNVQIIGSNLVISGTPDNTGEVDVVIQVSNCGSIETTDTYTGSINVLSAGNFVEKFTVANTQPNLCLLNTEIAAYYSGAFTPGVTVLYTDALMTTPVAGYDYVNRIDTGITYNLNDTTGVVGTATGHTCSW